ncbi:MAG: hypothetical protein PHX51_08545 [Clostridia bacterium]|nr:hypothetical protein [Clostridia bacterium]
MIYQLMLTSNGDFEIMSDNEGEDNRTVFKGNLYDDESCAEFLETLTKEAEGMPLEKFHGGK